MYIKIITMILTEIQKELIQNSKYYFSLIQECLYLNSNFLYYKWYRKLYGGQWRLLKFGKDTPYIRLFSTWTKVSTNDSGDDCWDGYYEVMEIENYPETGVITKFQLYKQFFKQLFSRKK